MLSSPFLALSPPQKLHFYPKTLIYTHIPKAPIKPINFSQNTLISPNSSIKLNGSSRNLLGFCSNTTPLVSEDFDVELGRMLSLLPEEMRRKISEHTERHQLIEVVMDLGRKPLARFPSGDFVLSDHPISVEDIEHATSLVSGIIAYQVFDELLVKHFRN